MRNRIFDFSQEPGSRSVAVFASPNSSLDPFACPPTPLHFSEPRIRGKGTLMVAAAAASWGGGTGEAGGTGKTHQDSHQRSRANPSFFKHLEGAARFPGSGRSPRCLFLASPLPPARKPPGCENSPGVPRHSPGGGALRPVRGGFHEPAQGRPSASFRLPLHLCRQLLRAPRLINLPFGKGGASGGGGGGITLPINGKWGWRGR